MRIYVGGRCTCSAVFGVVYSWSTKCNDVHGGDSPRLQLKLFQGYVIGSSAIEESPGNTIPHLSLTPGLDGVVENRLDP